MRKREKNYLIVISICRFFSIKDIKLQETDFEELVFSSRICLFARDPTAKYYNCQ